MNDHMGDHRWFRFGLRAGIVKKVIMRFERVWGQILDFGNDLWLNIVGLDYQRKDSR